MLNLIFLQSQGNPIMSFVPLLLVLAVIYFFFIRPQQKKQKEQNLFSSSLEKGDKIVTTSGLIAKINKIDDNEIQLQLDQKTFVKVVPGAISKEMTDQYFKDS